MTATLEVTQADSLKFCRRTAPAIDVLLPPGKLTAADIAALPTAQLPGLSVEVVGPDDPAYDLPFSHTLSDPGDSLATHADHEAHKADFVPVGKSKDKRSCSATHRASSS